MAKAFIRIIDGTAYLTVVDGHRMHCTDSTGARDWLSMFRRGVWEVTVLRGIAAEAKKRLRKEG